MRNALIELAAVCQFVFDRNLLPIHFQIQLQLRKALEAESLSKAHDCGVGDAAFFCHLFDCNILTFLPML